MKYYNCACCGKQFVVHEAWGYAYAGLYTCSYHCMRQMRREDLEGTEGPMKKHIYTDEDRVRIVEMHDAGMKNSEIAEKLDLKLMQVATFLGRRNKTQEKAPETVESARKRSKSAWKPSKSARKPRKMRRRNTSIRCA